MYIYIYIYYMTRKISSANMGFWSANIQRYYTVQQLIAQRGYKRLLTVERSRINGGKLILSLIYLCNCRIINNYFLHIYIFF